MLFVHFKLLEVGVFWTTKLWSLTFWIVYNGVVGAPSHGQYDSREKCEEVGNRVVSDFRKDNTAEVDARLIFFCTPSPSN